MKEIRLKHGAPVINICVLDRAGHPLPAPLEVQYERAKAPDLTGSHYVVVCSQQQIKVRPFSRSVEPFYSLHPEVLSLDRGEICLCSMVDWGCIDAISLEGVHD